MATAQTAATVPVDIRTTKKHSLVLNIPASLWPPPTRGVQIDGLAFAPKSELHVTLMGHALFDEMHAQLSQRVRRRLLAEARTWQWRIDRPGELRLLEHHDPAQPGSPPARSIIEMIDLAGAEDFYRLHEQHSGRQLPRSPPHVTLYTQGDAAGIGVPDAATLRRLTARTLTREELAAA